MQIAGNILLFLALLAAGSLFKMTFFEKMPGGDYGVGYSWVLLMFLAAFWICMALVACVIGVGGGYAWLSLGRFAHGGILVLCFLVMILGANLGMRGSYKMFSVLGLVSTVLTPLVLMMASAVLLNDGLKATVSAQLVKWGLSGVLGLNSLILATIILGMVVTKLNINWRQLSNKLDNFEMGILKQIDECDASKGITSLFIYSGNNQPRAIREKALLKIKSKPDWQEDLLKTLEGDGADEAFRYILDNEVDDRARFARGVEKGIWSQARLIREGLRRCNLPSNLYKGQFSSEVERALEAADQFQDLGVDFKPAVQELRNALEEPIAYDKPEFSCIKQLDKWLKKH
ncbi:MAG: hypothetical protein IPK88_03980 [Saprospiraceae bacterium]|nr:hypothetical protein [Candidatus Defluviibacterium haderslevense]